jgi:biotin carboxyl carrier protein
MDQQNNWLFDGVGVNASQDAHVTWEDQRFFTLTYQSRPFHGEILSNDIEKNSLLIKVNHRIIEVHKSGPLDALIASLGLDKPKVKQLKSLEAPMPGRIVRIAIEVGQELSPGDEILSLEAMKMENVLKSEGTGVVKYIAIEADQVVEKGMVLVEFE